jgi:hypothetical protein
MCGFKSQPCLSQAVGSCVGLRLSGLSLLISHLSDRVIGVTSGKGAQKNVYKGLLRISIYTLVKLKSKEEKSFVQVPRGGRQRS